MKVQSFRELVAWQKAMDLVQAVYELTARFPAEEKFGLTSQMRRAAVGVPSNIAEGFGRNGTADLVRFLHIARGTINELETQVEICSKLGFAGGQELAPVLALLDETARLIKGFINSLRP